jgi:SAM-dependent methyltransferase
MVNKLNDQAEFWNARYREGAYAFGEAPNVFLASQAHYLKPGARALVPGDGQGRNGVWLATQGIVVDSVDVSPLAVEKARELAAKRGVTINAQVADLLTWAWPLAQYDIVAAVYLHFFDADRPRMHRAMMDALKPGGVLVLEAFSLEQLELKKLHGSGGPGTLDMLFSKEKLASDFAGNSFILLEQARTQLDEGHRHKGPAAVVRAIVQKPLERGLE